MNRRLWGLLLAAPFVLGAGDPNADRFDHVVLDAGHGGEDRGAQGAGGLSEKDLVLDVARRLARTLKTRGIDVVMTRDLVPTEPKVQELKFYARDVGAVLSVHTDGDGGRASLVRYTPGA